MSNDRKHLLGDALALAGSLLGTQHHPGIVRCVETLATAFEVTPRTTAVGKLSPLGTLWAIVKAARRDPVKAHAVIAGGMLGKSLEAAGEVLTPGHRAQYLDAVRTGDLEEAARILDDGTMAHPDNGVVLFGNVLGFLISALASVQRDGQL